MKPYRPGKKKIFFTTLVLALLLGSIHILPNLYQRLVHQVPFGYQDDLPLKDTANYLEIVEKMRGDGFFPSDVSLHEYRDLPVYPQTIFLLPLLLMAVPAKVFGGELLGWLALFRFFLVGLEFSLAVYLVYRFTEHFLLAVFSGVLLFALPVELVAILFRTGPYKYLAWSKEHLLRAELSFNRFTVPLAGFLFFMAAIWALCRFLEQPDKAFRFWSGVIGVGCLFYVYPYYVSFMGVYLLVLVVIYFFTGERKRALCVVKLGGCSLALGLPAIYSVIKLRLEFPGWVAARQHFRKFPVRLTQEETNILIFLAVCTAIHLLALHFKKERWKWNFLYAYLPAFVMVFMSDILVGASVQKEHYPIRILLPWLVGVGSWLLYYLILGRLAEKKQFFVTVFLSGFLILSMIYRQTGLMHPPETPSEIKEGFKWLTEQAAPGEVFLSFDYDNIVYFKYHGRLRTFLTGMQNTLAPLTELFDRISCAFMISGIGHTTPGDYVWRDWRYYDRQRAREGWRKLSYHPWFFGPSQYPRQPELLWWMINRSHDFYPDKLKRFHKDQGYRRKILSRYRLDYLIYTSKEKQLKVNMNSPYLKKIYSNRLMKIFRVKSPLES